MNVFLKFLNGLSAFTALIFMIAAVVQIIYLGEYTPVHLAVIAMILGMVASISNEAIKKEAPTE